MDLRKNLVKTCSEHPAIVTLLTMAVCLILSLQIPKIQIDTDPENMLSEKEFVRVFHNRVKKEFTLYDIIVLGIVNEKNPNGVFNPETLKKIYQLTRQIERIDGVIPADLIAPSKVDDIQQAGLGTVRFEWLMPAPPKTLEEGLRIRDQARENPLLNGTLLSEDGKTLCLYIPIKSKDLSYQIVNQIQSFLKDLKGEERYHITGLSIAEDTFGVEMFKQMAESAPLAGLFIFLLMWFFFRKPVLIISPMIVAAMTVLCTMGLLIGTGHTVHIMSSMIPIFLMPIAVVDSIHILSEFFDRYQQFKDRQKTIEYVMEDLFSPMLFTSLTSAAGFASLALTPIPPVRVFGLFVAFGIMLAWVLTITFIPASIMFIKESSLKGFGLTQKTSATPSLLERLLDKTGTWTFENSRTVLWMTVVVMGISVVGISTIVVNDNPVKWFEKNHPIRIADRVLNSHFGGTYMAYLVLDQKTDATGFEETLKSIETALDQRIEEVKSFIPNIDKAGDKTRSQLKSLSEAQERNKDWSSLSLLKNMEDFLAAQAANPDETLADAWDELQQFFSEQKVALQPFKKPAALKYMESLQAALLQTGVVGKSNSVVDVVKKVHYELMEGNKKFNVVPNTPAAVAQTLLSYQNSHDPDDLWHLITPDYKKANIWIQLKSGDNRDMEFVEKSVSQFFIDHPPPIHLEYPWAGLTYLNVVWQDKMVRGMIRSLAGSFVVVLIMVVFLFRSPAWGLLCMIPLTVTITFIYGTIGFLGKDYDMPIAVLSAMTLGMSVDFAIHFLKRARSVYSGANRNWASTSQKMFGEPGRAITRNILVIAIGFTPLLIAPLVPYQTVGFFLASIMLVSGVATLLILPGLLNVFEGALFSRTSFSRVDFCHPVNCVSTGLITILIISYGIWQLRLEGWKSIVWVVAIGITGTALTCYFLSKRK